jgi:hypothetical protein
LTGEWRIVPADLRPSDRRELGAREQRPIGAVRIAVLASEVCERPRWPRSARPRLVTGLVNEVLKLVE